MTQDRVYRLVGELMSLAGQYDASIFREARAYVETTLQGRDRDNLLKVLDALGAMVAPPEPRDPDANTTKNTQASDVESRELRAILQDTAFLETKADVQEFAVKHLAAIPFSIDSKDSRMAFVRRLVDGFNHLPDAKRSAAYKSARRVYMKGRQSNLDNWSSIIANERQK
jgi:hypothetical protein